MNTEIELFLRKRIENGNTIWDVAESEVKGPSINIDVDNFNNTAPTTAQGGFTYYPIGSELPADYVAWKTEQENIINP